MTPNDVPVAKLANRNDLLKAWLSGIWRNERVRSIMSWALIICMAAWWLWPKGDSKSNSAQSHIRRVFQQDKAISKESEKKMGFKEKYWNATKVLAEMAEQLDAIDLNGCPQDFQAAYKKHVDAWKARVQFESSNTGMSGTLKNFITGGLLTPSIFKEGDSAIKQVNATFAEVKQIAIRYGVVP